MKLKKILAQSLAVAMVLSSVPVANFTALAAEDTAAYASDDASTVDATADAFPYLFRQVYRPADQTKLIRTITLLKQTAERVPLYRMQCNISHEAAKMAWKMMSDKKEEQNR